MLFKLVSLSLRLVQLLFLVIQLGLSARLVNLFAVDRSNFALAVIILSLIYLIAIAVFSFFQKFLMVGVLFIIESFIMILSLSSFAVLADTFGSANCNTPYYNFFSDFCKIGKAAIAFSFFLWLLFTASWTLLLIFTIIPLGKNIWSFSSTLYPGLIFPTSDGAKDLEKDEVTTAHELAHIDVNAINRDDNGNENLQDSNLGGVEEITFNSKSYNPIADPVDDVYPLEPQPEIPFIPIAGDHLIDKGEEHFSIQPIDLDDKKK